MPKKRNRGRAPQKCCETCDECCGSDGSPSALVLEEYAPGEDYFACGGKKWTPQ